MQSCLNRHLPCSLPDSPGRFASPTQQPLADDPLWACGSNIFGQLGVGVSYSVPIPARVTTSADVSSVSAGTKHSLFVKADGSLLGSGGNDSGQLGDGRITQRTSLTRLSSAVSAASAGGSHTLIRTTDNSLMGVGSNYNGQLGTSSSYQWLSPRTMLGSGASSMAAGNAHTLFIKSDSTLWVSGSNSDGQLGSGTAGYSQYAPVAIAGAYSAVAAGINHSFALRTDIGPMVAAARPQ